MKNNDDPSLDDLAVFIAVCDARGFRAAAKRLQLSPSNVSDIITRLERRLGVALLTRNTRSVMPTEQGEALRVRLAPLLAETRAALREVGAADAQLRGILKLNVAIAQGCAAGIRYGEHLAQDRIAVPIGPRRQQLALAAAPAYLAARGTPGHPHELARHDCVRMRFGSGALTAWDFERDGECITVDPPGRLIIGVDAAAAAIELACAGHGLICTFRNWLDPYFASGRLAPVLSDWWQQFDGPQLYFPSRRMPPPLRAFIDMLAESDHGEDGGALPAADRST
jgi:DNA-binding transcriptional LysR family regulator